MTSRLRNAWRVLRGHAPVVHRRVLPYKRDSATIKFEFGGHKWHCTSGHFKDGTLAEIFMNSAKTGELMRVMCRDSAVLASLALQYGCPAEVMRKALTREEGGEAGSPMAVAMDKLMDEER